MSEIVQNSLNSQLLCNQFMKPLNLFKNVVNCLNHVYEATKFAYICCQVSCFRRLTTRFRGFENISKCLNLTKQSFQQFKLC